MERIGIVVASVRERRRGEPIARWIHGLAAAREGVAAELVDLREWPLGAYTHEKLAGAIEGAYAPDSLEGRWAALVRGFDAFAIVTPEYNHGYPGQLKNALDALYAAWNYKPVAFVSYGGNASGARAAEQLAQVAIELRMVPIRDGVNIRLIGLATDEHGAPTDEFYTKRANAMLDELLWYARVLGEARAARVRA